MTVQKQSTLSNNNCLLFLLGLPGFMVSSWPDGISKHLLGSAAAAQQHRERFAVSWEGAETLSSSCRGPSPGQGTLAGCHHLHTGDDAQHPSEQSTRWVPGTSSPPAVIDTPLWEQPLPKWVSPVLPLLPAGFLPVGCRACARDDLHTFRAISTCLYYLEERHNDP